MPHTPPIGRRKLGKLGIFNEERFFRLLSEKCGYIDPTTTKLFYLSLVKLISSELRSQGILRLPHLGDMALVAQKAHKGRVGRAQVMIGPSKVLKFYPDSALRRYFNEFSGKGPENKA